MAFMKRLCCVQTPRQFIIKRDKGELVARHLWIKPARRCVGNRRLRGLIVLERTHRQLLPCCGRIVGSKRLCTLRRGNEFPRSQTAFSRNRVELFLHQVVERRFGQ